MARDLDALIARLAEALDMDAQQPTEDQHARWDVYRSALVDHSLRDLVLEALNLEPNAPLASATVVRALEHVSPSEREQWVAALSSRPQHDYARRRAAELGILERLRSDPHVHIGEAEVRGWTDWLQARVVEESARHEVLVLLKDVGTTKRIRRRAQERVNQL